MVQYSVEIQHVGEEDNGYGFYCNLEQLDNVQLHSRSQMKTYTDFTKLPPELYPAEYYFDDDHYDDDLPLSQEKYNDEYKKMVKQFKTKAYSIFSELSFACLCIATTLCVMKYYK